MVSGYGGWTPFCGFSQGPSVTSFHCGRTAIRPVSRLFLYTSFTTTTILNTPFSSSKTPQNLSPLRSSNAHHYLFKMGRNYFRDAVDFTRGALRKRRLEDIEHEQRREEAWALKVTRVRHFYYTHRHQTTQTDVWPSTTGSTPGPTPVLRIGESRVQRPRRTKVDGVHSPNAFPSAFIIFSCRNFSLRLWSFSKHT